MVQITKRRAAKTKATATNSGLPYGSGSIQMRRRSWWLVYRDTAGVVQQVNSGTDDQALATRMLAERAIEVLEARLAVLRAVASDTEGPAESAGGRAGSAAVTEGRGTAAGTAEAAGGNRKARGSARKAGR